MAIIPGHSQAATACHRCGLVAMAQLMRKNAKTQAIAERNRGGAGQHGRAREPEPPAARRSDQYRYRLRMISLADAESGGTLLSRVTLIRRQIATDLGMIVPTSGSATPVSCPPTLRRASARCEVARAKCAPSLLAMNPGAADTSMRAGWPPAIEPAFGLPARWISMEDREHAECSATRGHPTSSSRRTCRR